MALAVSSATDARGAAPTRPAAARVVLASSLGTVFEWYDFYLYGALAPIVAARFFADYGHEQAYLLALVAFAAGFVMRPFGALLFGRFGDQLGRKHALVATLLVMGLATFAVGMLPDAEAIGVAAPVMLIVLRLLQGLALGGEYGGAATLLAEHAPPGRRGATTGWLQTTASAGLLLAIATVETARGVVGEEAFSDWGWRLPFLAAAALLPASLWIRRSVAETPVFRDLRARGLVSHAPLAEALGCWSNLRLVAVAVVGAVAGQAAVWYTAQFYPLVFLTRVLHVDGPSASAVLAVALVASLPLYVAFGALSDRLGRKRVILAGLLCAALAIRPLFHALAEVVGIDGGTIDAGTALWWQVLGILWLLMACSAMVYGPLAALLVELFVTRLRYTCTGFAYHLGNGWIGGVMPLLAFSATAGHGDVLRGLWIAVALAAASFVVGAAFLRETRGAGMDPAG